MSAGLLEELREAGIKEADLPPVPVRFIDAESLHAAVGPEAVGIPLVDLFGRVAGYEVTARIGTVLMTVEGWRDYVRTADRRKRA